jgi:hypothetical protein
VIYWNERFMAPPTSSSGGMPLEGFTPTIIVKKVDISKARHRKG